MIKNRLLVLAGLVLTLSLSAPKNVFCSAAPETAKDARERLEPLFFGLHDRALNDAGLQIIKDYASNSVRYFVSDYQEDMQLVASFVNTTIDNLVNRDLKAPNKSCKWIIFHCEKIQTLCDVYHHRITEPQGQNLVAAYNKIKDDPTLLLATNRLGRMLGLPPITLRDIPTAEKPAEAPKPLLEAPRRVPPAAHTPSQSASIAGAGAGAGSAAQPGDLINAAQSAEFLRILSNKELTIAKRREAYTQINTLLDNGFVPSKEQLIPIKYVGLIERFPERMPTCQATPSDPVLTADQRRFYEEMEALYSRVQRIINQNKARLATGTGAGSAVTDAAQRVAPSAPAESASFAGGAGAGAGSAGGASAEAADSSSEDAVGQIQRLFTGIQAIVNDPAAMLLKDQHGQATRLAQEAAEIMGRERLSLQTKENLMSLYHTRIYQKLTD
jgi:hypothetical protein